MPIYGKIVAMKNELLFFSQTILIAVSMLGALALGKEALIASISFLFVLANLFVVKQIALFGFNVTSADIYIIGAVLGSNLLQEFFGARIAKKAIWIGFFISFLFISMSHMHLWYQPNAYDFAQGSYVSVLGLMPRIVGASFIAYFASQYLRFFLYGTLQKWYGTSFLVGRNIVVTVVEQALDTVVFGFIGLYGVVHSLTDIFLLSFTIKVITILCMAPWLAFVRRFMKGFYDGK